MDEEEKLIKIKIQNDNCLIYLKNNELSILDKTKYSKSEDNIYDDIKEMSYSVSNISENYSSKRRKNSKKNISKEKAEFEISNISIFNSNLKKENSNLKTPLEENINEINNNNQNLKSIKKKEINEQNFIENLKSKNLSIKKLNFDSAELDTIQETDTIKKLYNNKNNTKVEKESTLNVENINKNLHNQFISNTSIDFIDINFKNNNNIENKSSNNIIQNQKNNKKFHNELFDNKKRFNEIKINDKNINSIKNEIISTIKYKSECIEKYNFQIENNLVKPLIYNNKQKIELKSFSKDKTIKKNGIIYIKPKEFHNKDKDKKNIDKINVNSHNFQILDKKKIINKNFSYVKKRGILNKSLKKYNSEKNLNRNKVNSNLNDIKPFYFEKNIIKNNFNKRICSYNLNDDFNNQRNYEKKFYLTNSYFNTTHFRSSFSKNNIFIKKNVFVYNNYLSHLKEDDRNKNKIINKIVMH